MKYKSQNDIKKLISLTILLCTATQIIGVGAGQITNLSSDPVTVVFYTNYSPAKPGATAIVVGTPATTRAGLITIPGAGSTSIIGNTNQIEVYYDHGGNISPLSLAINATNDYTINPGSPAWFITT